jgi:hypothetical protein
MTKRMTDKHTNLESQFVSQQSRKVKEDSRGLKDRRWYQGGAVILRFATMAKSAADSALSGYRRRVK